MGCQDVDCALVEVAWMGGDVANPLQGLDGGDCLEQGRKVGSGPWTLVGIDRLTEKLDLLKTVGCEGLHFPQHILQRAAEFASAGVWDHAERAELVAALHDRYHASGRALAEDGLEIVFPLGIEAGQHRPVTLCDRTNGLPYPADLARSEDETDAPGPAEQRCPLLLGNAAANADGRGAVELFQHTDPADNLLNRAVANGAGVEDHQIRGLWIPRRLHAFRAELSLDQLAIVLIHLAAPGFNEIGSHSQFSPHRRKCNCAAPTGQAFGRVVDAGIVSRRRFRGSVSVVAESEPRFL